MAVPQTAGWTAKPVQRGLAPAPVSTGEYPTSANGTPIFKQGDAEWGRTRLGKGGATISQAGCAMTSTAMAMSKITGKLLTPKDFDAWLDKNRGYSKDAIDWSRAGKARGLDIQPQVFSQKALDGQLDAGRPVVLGVDYKPGSNGGAGGTDHWICVTGKRVDDKGVTRYLANDPGTGKEIELVMQKGRLVGDGKDALGKYRSAGTMRVFSGSLELG